MCEQFECGGMVLEEAPGKVCEAFRLFVQGMGHGMYSHRHIIFLLLSEVLEIAYLFNI